jgi:hypothetical protein
MSVESQRSRLRTPSASYGVSPTISSAVPATA